MLIDNRSPWAVAVMGVADVRGEPALCIVVEATCAGGRPAEVQPPVELAGRWEGEPGASPLIEAPGSPVPKAGTDVIVRGHAVAAEVAIRVGQLEQRLRITGDRTWEKGWLGIRPSAPAAWERMPLTWERAFGGRDSDAVEARNPLGCGFRRKKSAFSEGLRLPNLEHPEHPLTRWGQTPPPVGCGFTLPAFAHRRERRPFDPAGANAAAPELIAPDGLHGGEEAVLTGVRPEGPWAFRLPLLPPPRLRLASRRGDAAPAAALDTVLLDADAGTVRLTWRAWTRIDEPALIEAVEIA